MFQGAERGEPEQAERYARQLRLPGVGAAGQARLGAARVLIVGVGGLGVPAALHLAAAGVGRIGLIDGDAVQLSNLHRQPLYATEDVGRAKVAVAAERLRALNPHVTVEAIDAPLTARNALAIVGRYDLVLDCSDNFPTRYLINDACSLTGRPDVFGAAHRFEGQVGVFWRGHGPCYRCLQPRPPAPEAVPSCAEAGVLGTVPAVVGTMQATEALKILLGVGEPLLGRLLLYDALEPAWAPVRLRRNAECVLCGDHPTQTGLIDYEAFCRGSPSTMDDERSITPTQVQAMRQRGDAFVLLDVREPEEIEVASLPGTLNIPAWEVQGRVNELDRAQTIVVLCHHGSRSALVANWLRSQGFPRVKNLRGGIAAWSREVDPAIPTY